MTVLNRCLLLFFLSPLTQALAAHTKYEPGPTLTAFLEACTQLGYSYAVVDEGLSLPGRPYVVGVSVSDESGKILMTFAYQSVHEESSSFWRENFLNVKRGTLPLVETLLAPVLTASQSSPPGRFFTQTTLSSITEGGLLALSLGLRQLETSEYQTAEVSLYSLMKDAPPEAPVQFLPLPPEELKEAEAFLPVISLELFPQTNRLHYLRYLVPAHILKKRDQENTSLGVDVSTAQEVLQSYRRFAVTMDVGKERTTIYPSIYDGSEIISDVALEIYALSDYIEGFMNWFVGIWWQEFPRGQQVVMKKTPKAKKSVELSLYKHRVQLCSTTLRDVSKD